MAVHLTAPAGGFPPGLSWVTTLDEAEDPSGLALGVLRLAAGERWETVTTDETAWILMQGQVQARVGNQTADLARGSLFDEAPSAIHVPAGTPVAIEAAAPTELTVYATANQARFGARIFRPAETPNEHRGRGQVADASYRWVRTIFDGRNSDPAAKLVLGEVVTMPGRWSSYPPHHHPHPEIYHYRFTQPRGYGHAELGETVLKVRHGDTVKILDGVDHPQCAAPGYGMYYAWVIRHLPGLPYTVPDFTAEHRWTMSSDEALLWRPRDA